MPMPLHPDRLLLGLLISFLGARPASSSGDWRELPTAPSLQSLVTRAADAALAAHRQPKLEPAELAITVIDLRDLPRATRASFRGDVPIYPASVIKLFFLAATHQWLQDRRLEKTAELQRALRDMIVDSSNDATHYVVDLLTGTTSGPELPVGELKVWFEKRNVVTRHFAALGYDGVIACKKPWADGPYGRESQAIRLFEPKRNALTTDATARLLAEIATGRCVSTERSAEMMKLLARDPSDREGQGKYTGSALPPGARLWSKAGWTSQVRHDAAYIELPGGARFVLVVFTTNHAAEAGIIQAVAQTVAGGLGAAGIETAR